MRVIYFILILGFISCKTYDNVIDVWYNYEYSLLKDYTQVYNQWNIRLPVNAGDKMNIEIKIPKNDDYYFNMEVYALSTSYVPSPEEIASSGVRIYYKVQSYYYEGDYIVHYETYQTAKDSGITYFAIHVKLTSWNPYSYLIFRVNLYKYKYSNIKDLNFNQEYQIDKSIFDDDLIPDGYQIYIRLSAIEQDNMEVQIDTHVSHNKDNDFQVNVCQYTYKPTETQVYYPTYDSLCKD